MSLLYSGLYLITNILGPISFMVYTQLKSFTFLNKNQENLSKNVKIVTEQQHNLKSNYGKWFMLIISIFVFNFISALFPKSLIVIFLGLILKALIIKSPYSLVNFISFQNHSLEQIIQKLHFQIYLQKLKSTTIETYLDLSEKLNFCIIFYRIEEKEERFHILSQIKDSASRIQNQLEDNEEIKNKSFIVAVKKMQTMKNIKSYENIGVNCDILKGSEVGKELLKILQQKTLAKERSQGTSRSKIQQPTKDKLDQNKRGAQSALQPPRSQSLQQKIQKIKHSVNVPTSEKKILKKQHKQDESQYAIQRSQTFDIDQLEFEQSPSKNREHNYVSYYPKTQKDAAKPQSSSSIASNPQNVGLLDIVTSERSLIKKGSTSPNKGSLEGILQCLDQTNQGQPLRLSNQDQPTSPNILPHDANISSINYKAVHPFKMNLSSLTNPLLISDQPSKTKILPSSLYGSQQALLLSSDNRKLVSNSSNEQVKKQHLQNISQVQTQIMMEKQFSQQSSISNKMEVQIGQSEYSDMFQSEGDEEEPTLQIKVQAIMESSTNGLKSKLDICYIQLYDNREMKFYSVHDKLTFYGRILRMTKNTNNFYDILCESFQKVQDGDKAIKNQKTQIVKKVKFRGQAKPFMKYLEKTQQ